MTCLEAQSMITAFIEEKLDGGELEEFIYHMRHCSDCKEELEVYYTLMVGMKQLDENEKLSNNFAEELETKLEHYESLIKGRKRVVLETKVGVTVVITLLLVVVFFQLTALLVNFRKPLEGETTSKYYYIKVRPNLFYPDDFKLRNPYSGIDTTQGDTKS